MKLNKIIKFLLCGIFVCCMTGFTAFATDYNSYTYDSEDEVIECPDAYDVEKVVTGIESEAGAYSSPSDLYADVKGNLYIADSGNDRIVVLDSSKKFIKQYSEFFYNDEKTTLFNPTGIFVKEDLIYISDTGNSRIIVCDKSGIVKMILTKPKEELYPQNMAFSPSRISVDNRGNIYALCEGVYYGAVTFNSEGKFIGFFGCNEIDVTLSLVADYAWRSILNYEQRSQLDRYLPIAYSSIDIDENGFVYVCTSVGETGGNIRKLNFKGSDVITEKQLKENEKTLKNAYVDVICDSYGFITALDKTNKRVLQYDREGNLLYVFGLGGNRWGTFTEPVAIAFFNNELYVLDKTKCSITILEPTDFGAAVREATIFYNSGEFEKAIKPWNTVLKESSNYETAYVGIGKSHYFSGDYDKAAEYFEYGGDKKWHSKAFKEIRSEWLHKYFIYIITAVCLLFAIFILLNSPKFPLNTKYKKIKHKLAYHHTDKEKFRFAMYVVSHPIDGFLELREKSRSSVAVAFVIYLFSAIGIMIKSQFTGFRFNNNPEAVYAIGIGLALIFFLFTVSNWALCVLFDSEAFYKDIFCCLAYSIIPYTASLYLSTLLSYVLCIDEGMIITLVNAICILWSILLLVISYKEIHQYTTVKTIISLLCTLIALILLAFLLFMAVSLIQQVVSFIKLAVSELSYRTL